jgi:hypothetical protein
VADIKELERIYAVPLQRYGKYVKIINVGFRRRIRLEVKNQHFDVGFPIFLPDIEEEESLQFIRIMLCQALNVMYILENEGIDTSDIPETEFVRKSVNAMVRKSAQEDGFLQALCGFITNHRLKSLNPQKGMTGPMKCSICGHTTDALRIP